MGSDDDVDFTVIKLSVDILFILLRCTADQQLHMHSIWQKLQTQAVMMLLRQDLRRSHKGTLIPVQCRVQQGIVAMIVLPERHPLDEPGHGVVAIEIRVDIFESPILSTSQLKGKFRDKPFHVAVSDHRKSISLLLTCSLMFFIAIWNRKNSSKTNRFLAI